MRTPLILAILIAASLALPALDAQGQAGQGGAGGAAANRTADGPGAAARQTADQERTDWERLSVDARQRGLARAEQARLFALFNVSGNDVSGRFVSFNLTNGDLAEYTVTVGSNATTFFSIVDASDFGADGTPRANGATLRVLGDNASLGVHNNPAGIFVYRAGERTLDLAFAPGPEATIRVESNRTALVTVGTVHGHVIVQGDGEIANGTDGGITVSLRNESGVMFAAHPQQSLLGENLHNIRDAAAQDRVGGILSVVAVDDEPLQDRVDLGVSLRAVEASQGRARINVSSNETGPRSVVLNLDGSVINETALERVRVLLDGQEIPVAGNATEALLASQATYHANATALGVQVLVNIPTFSDHEIVVATDDTTDGTTTDGTTTDGTTTDGTTTDGTTGDGTTATPTPADEGADTPAAGVALVLALVGVVALALRRR